MGDLPVLLHINEVSELSEKAGADKVEADKVENEVAKAALEVEEFSDVPKSNVFVGFAM